MYIHSFKDFCFKQTLRPQAVPIVISPHDTKELNLLTIICYITKQTHHGFLEKWKQVYVATNIGQHYNDKFAKYKLAI